SPSPHLDSSAPIPDSPRVFKRLGHVFLIVALLLATGSHWALLQSVAWTNMLADNLRTYSFTEAVDRTFDGKHPSRLCCHTADGKKSDTKSEAPLEIKKLEFIQLSAPIVVTAPRMLELEVRDSGATASRLYRPPSPPPRDLFA